MWVTAQYRHKEAPQTLQQEPILVVYVRSRHVNVSGQDSAMASTAMTPQARSDYRTYYMLGLAQTPSPFDRRWA